MAHRIGAQNFYGTRNRNLLCGGELVLIVPLNIYGEFNLRTTQDTAFAVCEPAWVRFIIVALPARIELTTNP